MRSEGIEIQRNLRLSQLSKRNCKLHVTKYARTRTNRKHAHADRATCAVFWQRRLA